MRSSHRIGPVANWKFYPSPELKIEMCSLKAEHEPIPDIFLHNRNLRPRYFTIKSAQTRDKSCLATKLRENFYTVCNILHCFFCVPIGKYYT